MHNKRTAPPMNVGISLLLVVFLILCLFTFSAIALTSAKDEYQNSLNRANRTSEYYAAASKAEIKLKDMSEKVLALKGEDLGIAPMEYSIPINDYQNLEITIAPNNKPGQKPYRITRWQTIPSTKWQTDDTMQVFAPQINLD